MTDQAAEQDALPQPVGRPQGGMKSDAARAAYWRMNYESAIGALADLIAEHTELVEAAQASLLPCEVHKTEANCGCRADRLRHFLPPGSVQMSTNEDIHPMSTNEDIHDLVDRKCTCGWEPALGTSIYRSFDKHLLEVRGG